MQELKRRLMETEAQMSRILQAMDAVQQKVGATLGTKASNENVDTLVSSNFSGNNLTSPILVFSIYV